MKKLLFIFGFSLFMGLGIKAQAASLELIYPNGGEEWIGGETYEIQWWHENLNKVRITLEDINGVSIENPKDVDLEEYSTEGSYSYTVPVTGNGKDYFKVELKGYPLNVPGIAIPDTVEDKSDEVFSIKPGVSIVSLNDFDEALIVDNRLSIYWEFNPDDVAYSITLDLYKDGEKLGRITGASFNHDYYSWDMTYDTDNYDEQKPGDGDNYQIHFYTAQGSMGQITEDAYPIEVFSDNFSITSYDYDSDIPGDDDSDDSGDSQISIDYNLTNQLKGKILLQVEENGEAWYVKPSDGKRIYMKDGEVAYNMMRDLGLGITNNDLAKIPIGIEDRFECLDTDNDGLCNKLEEGLGTDINNSDSDGDGYNDGLEVKNGYNPLGSNKLTYDNSLINNLKGKILLQVESRGEAWYVNPDDNKRYYMTDGDAAYQIMRFLSLGITNIDLEKIRAE